MKFKNAATCGVGFCTPKTGAILREMAAAVATALIVVSVLWSAILGMSEGPGPGSIVSFTLAGVQHDGR